MSQVGRNDPCPCGSGRKHKRCCLARDDAAARGAREVGGAYGSLVDLAHERYMEICTEGFDRYYAPLGYRGFGALGPDLEHASAAQACYLFDPQLGPGTGSLFDALRGRLGSGAEPLAGSSIRLWRLGGAAELAGWARVRCPLSDERAVIRTRRGGEGAREGALIAARSAPLAPGRALVFGPVAVAPEVEDELLAEARERLGSLPTAEAWERLGGELSRLASAWPEERGITREGEPVRGVLAQYELRRPSKAERRLAADPELDETVAVDELETEPGEDERAWSWRPPMRPAPVRREPERGIRWRLDRDDADHDRLARTDLATWEERLWISAATPARMALAESRIKRRLGRSLGRLIDRDLDGPDVLPHWQSVRLARLWSETPTPIAPGLDEPTWAERRAA